MEVRKVKIENPNDREAVAKQIGEAVADIIASAESAKSTIPEERKTDVDDIDGKTLKAKMESEEFKTFEAGLMERINSLSEYIDAHQKEWNCSFIASIIAINGKENRAGGVAFTGRADSIKHAMQQILEEKQLRPLVKRALLDQVAGEFDTQENSDEETAKE